MSDRPTPEQIMEHNWPYSWTQQLERLAEHGYVIVHPDDMRARDEAIIRAVCNFLPVVYDDDYPLPKRDIDAIIDAAEQETP